MQFSILGSIKIHADGLDAEIHGRIQQILLGALLVSEGRTVARGALIDELWAETSPRNAENALQAHVSRLRRRLSVLEPDRQHHRLQSSSAGYCLLFDETELDATRFMKALRELCSEPQLPPANMVRELRGALALWRGPAFDSLAGATRCQAAAVRYEESRLAALELLYDNELKMGRHAEILPELRELSETWGLNERLCEQLMVALYRAGRQADALAVYREMWMRLNDEIGIEPSPTLKRHEHAILTHHPVLGHMEDHLILRA